MEKVIGTKICKKCATNFEITDRDETFYKKMDVPAPTLCPACRMQRLMSFRNERVLYKRKCDFSGKEILSIFPPLVKTTVYDQEIWWSDKWNALNYGVDFDFNKTFSEQFGELARKVPKINLDNKANENSDYCNDTEYMKNSYLCFNCEQAQNMYYCTTGGYSRDCMDLFWTMQCELCYECTKTIGAYHCFWCMNCNNISDCYFCEDLIGCKNCFGCIGMHQKEYTIFNKQVGKEAFEAFIHDFKFTHENINKTKKQLAKLRLQVPHRYLQIIQCEDCSGDYMTNSRNCTKCFDVMESDNCKYVWDGVLNNGYDCLNTGFDSSFIYFSLCAYRSNNVKFMNRSSSCSDCSYCYYCFNLEKCFGCVSLIHKKNCILNKQYSDEEYDKLLSRIIEHMRAPASAGGGKKTGEWGEFFTPAVNLVGYNDSLADYYFPLTKEEAQKQGFSWNNYEKPILDLASIEGKNLPNDIADVDDKILNKLIRCETDGKYFRIIQPELDFYKKHGIALPHLCPDCRHFARKNQMNKRVLYDRKCDKCEIAIKSTYSPDRPEIVYCEKCYLETII